MARFYGLPLRASNACAANCPDAQAAWESAFSLWAAVSARVNMVYHAAGWLEGGLCASYEKFVMDCEMLQQIIHYMQPMTVTADDIAIDAIAEVGPNGHFFGIEHTQARYESAFYSPFLSDWRNFESWQEAGGVMTVQRANKVWKDMLANFEAPPLDESIREELEAFVERRKREGGAPTDF
jgi:trimethylamine--corrinoid protein Co-methyltransferase